MGSVEIHSIVVILGIYFFYQVWGVPGMLLSVPLLAVLRIVMKSLAQMSSSGGKDADALAFLDSILEGRWMSSAVLEPDSEDGDTELSDPGNQEFDEPGASPAAAQSEV